MNGNPEGMEKAQPFARSLDSVKSTTSDVYKRLENSQSVVMKLGLTVASPGVSFGKYIFTSTEPYVDQIANKLDDSFGTTVQSIQESPAKIAGGLKERTEEIGKVLDYNQDGVVSAMDLANSSVAGGLKVVDGMVCTFQNRWDALLTAGQVNLDYYLPDYDAESEDDIDMNGDECAGAHDVEDDMEHIYQRSLKGLSTTATKRVRDRMNAGFGEIRKFSSGRLKEIVHVDLIEYAEKVIDSSKGVVTYLEDSSERLQNEANAYLGHKLLPNIKTAIDSATETTAKLQQTLKDTIDPRREHLSMKLQEAIERASHTMSPVRKAVVPYVGNVSEKVNSLGGGIYTLLDTVPVNEIPRDVWLVLAGTMGIRECDPRFNDVVEQIRDVFRAVVDLEKLSESAQNEMENSEEAEIELERKEDVILPEEDIGAEDGDDEMEDDPNMPQLLEDNEIASKQEDNNDDLP